MQGGIDLADLRPLGSDGNVEPDLDGTEVLGCHQAHMGILNVRGAQPGFAYFYARLKPSPDVPMWMMQGAEIVQAGDPEYLGSHLDPKVAAAIDSVQAFQDVVLMRMPDTSYRRFKEQEQARADAQTESAERAFVDHASESEAAYGRRGPTRFARPDHRTYRDDI